MSTRGFVQILTMVVVFILALFGAILLDPSGGLCAFLLVLGVLPLIMFGVAVFDRE